MELVLSIAVELGTVVLCVLLLAGTVFSFRVKELTSRLTCSLIGKQLARYRANGMNVHVAPSAVEDFIDTVAMCVYGLMLTLISLGILVIGYRFRSTTDLGVIFIVAKMSVLFGLAWTLPKGYAAYRCWKDSFLTLQNQHPLIPERSE